MISSVVSNCDLESKSASMGSKFPSEFLKGIVNAQLSQDKEGEKIQCDFCDQQTCISGAGMRCHKSSKHPQEYKAKKN